MLLVFSIPPQADGLDNFLYRAGILVTNDEYNLFTPYSYITRSGAIHRYTKSSERVEKTDINVHQMLERSIYDMVRRKIFILLMSFLIVALSACNKTKDINLDNTGHNLTAACEEDLTTTLEELKSSTTNEKSYIYSSSLSVVKSSSDFSSDINKKIARLVEYTILDVSVNGESAIANAQLIVPDVYFLIKEIASEMQENNIDRLLEQLDGRLDEDVPTKEYEIKVDLKLVNEHWYLVPSGELSNAFSGGIIEQYSMMGQNVVEDLLEGEDDG